MFPELYVQRGALHVDPHVGQNELRHEDGRPLEVWPDGLELAQPAPGVNHYGPLAITFLQRNQRRQVRVTRNENVDVLRTRGRAHWRWSFSQHDIADLVSGIFGGRVACFMFEAHSSHGSPDNTPDHEEEDCEYEQDYKPIETDVEKELMHREQFLVIAEEPCRVSATVCQKESNRPVDRVRHQ